MGNDSDELTAFCDSYRIGKPAEPRNRCRDGGPTHGETLVGLDWIETLREVVHNMGHDDHHGVLQVRRHLCVGSLTQNMNVLERVQPNARRS
jgi:hypothetical protein